MTPPRAASRRPDRRTLLRALGVGVSGVAGLSANGRATGHEDGEGNSGDSGSIGGGRVVFEEQDSDGDSIVVGTVKTPTDGVLMVQERADSDETLFARQEIAEGSHEHVTVELDESIGESQTIEVWLFDGSPFEDDSEVLAIDEAFVTVGGDGEPDVLGVTYVEADAEFGFHYPYYLFAPPPTTDEPVPTVVEPNNSGRVNDDLEIHRQNARDIVDGGISRRLSEDLDVPLVVPVFPRPEMDPVDNMHYVHSLDRDTMLIGEGPLERVDLQLLRMTDHARGLLSETEHVLSDQLLLNGFSASGNFVDRFAVLHPDRVLSVTAGGLNGMALLPLEEADGHTLPFHVGIADVEEITGEPVDLDALDAVDQFLYMGAEDTNDTIPYDDAWTDDDLRQTALDVYGEDMIEDRFPRCEAAYEEAGVAAEFRVYEGAGHSPHEAREDVLAFHRSSLEDATLSDASTPDVELSTGGGSASESPGDGTTGGSPGGPDGSASSSGPSNEETAGSATTPAGSDGRISLSTRDFLLGTGFGTVMGSAITGLGTAYWVLRRDSPTGGDETEP